jgi:enoyl-CoA hydratase/carnithine racemase
VADDLSRVQGGGDFNPRSSFGPTPRRASNAGPRSTKENAMSPAEETMVRYETDEKVSIITLDRPSKLNAINAAMKNQIIEAFARADQDPATSVVVLRANGRSFSAGFDIGHSPDRGQESGAADPNTWDPILHRSFDFGMAPWSTRKPVIASVHGHVLGGGCELTLMCDLTIAADDARFGEPEVRFSHLGPLMVMPWIIGLKRARELLFFGDMIDAQTALEFGMINRIVPAAELRTATMKYAKRLALISPEALRWGKRAINRGAEVAGFRAALETGVDAFVSLYATKTEVGREFGRIAQEKGLKAALDWRAAQFRQ